jgi:uncharacterized protein YdiU (UPF0061 family)
LANALYPIIEDAKPLEAILNQYKIDFERKSLQMMQSKLGLQLVEENDLSLIQDLEEVLQLTPTDMTIFFRLLSDITADAEGLEEVKKAFYNPKDITGTTKRRWNHWFEKYHARLQRETRSHPQRKEKMDAVNPKYVLRNYMAQLAIDAAKKGDYSLINELFELLKKPYSEQPEKEKWFAKRPDWAKNKIGCSMLSCSS